MAEVWLAREGEEPVSTVWLCQSGSSIGIMEMMTPERHLYESVGFDAIDESLTCYRGLDPSVLEAFGQVL